MRTIEFVSYDGAYPNLCSGNLVLNIDGKACYFEHSLSSGGQVSFDDNWNEEVKQGPWTFNPDKDDINSYNLTADEIEYAEFIINKNVPHGCCGGCV